MPGSKFVVFTRLVNFGYYPRPLLEAGLLGPSGKKARGMREAVTGQVAQLVEQWTENPCVAGSIPALPIRYFHFATHVVFWG